MKVYTFIELDMSSGEVLHEESYEHNGSVALCTGGSGGNDASDTSEVTNKIELTPQQQKILKPAVPRIVDFVENPPQQYAGSLIPQLNQQQVAGQQQLIGAAGQQQGIANDAATAQRFLSSGAVLDPRLNPGLQGSIDAAIRPITQAYQENVLPSINDSAIASGQFGGSRQGIAEGRAAEGYQRAVGDTTANIVNPAYQAGLQAFTQGVGLSPLTQAAQAQPGQTLASVGNENFALQQARVQEEAQKYANEQLIPYLAAKQAWELAFSAPSGSTNISTGQATQSAPSGPGPAVGALGGAASGAAIGSMFGGVGAPVGAGIGAILGGLFA